MTTEPYIYEELVSSNSIRVFDLSPSSKGSGIFGILRQVSLPEDADTSSALSYAALSYTWGSPNDKHWRIWVDGKPVLVRDNLYTALQTLRDQQISTTLWIDALCINQNDVYEKNHQVGLMAQIYRTAERVKVWLGPEDENSTKVAEFLRHGGAPLLVSIQLEHH